MKHLRETFTDQEWEILKAAKESVTWSDGKHLTWHDLILLTIPYTTTQRLGHELILKAEVKTK